MNYFTVHLANQIKYDAHLLGLRTGQCLFNRLPSEAAFEVSGSLWDPFHKEFNVDGLIEWIDNHLILNDTGTEIIGLFNREQLLWYYQPPAIGKRLGDAASKAGESIKAYSAVLNLEEQSTINKEQ